jgi:hypothetical protein
MARPSFFLIVFSSNSRNLAMSLRFLVSTFLLAPFILISAGRVFADKGKHLFILLSQTNMRQPLSMAFHEWHIFE